MQNNGAFRDEAAKRWFAALSYLFRNSDGVTYSFVTGRLRFLILDDKSLTFHRLVERLTKVMMPSFWWWKTGDNYYIECDPMSIILSIVEMGSLGLRKPLVVEKSEVQGYDADGSSSLF